MALPSTHRWIIVGAVLIRNRKRAPDFAPDFFLGDLVSAIKDKISEGEIYRSYQKEKHLMWCDQIDEGKGFW